MSTNAQKEYCVIDCRVSDPSQLKGGSLENQETIGREVARKLGVEVARVFRKPHSATTTIREDIDEIKTFIKKDGRLITHYIIKSIDRLTREGYIEYTKLKDELEDIGLTVIDSEGVIQPKKNTLDHLGGSPKYRWSVYSPSESAEMFETYKGKAEVRDILTRLIGAEIKLTQDGYAVRRAPDGLKNKKVIVEAKSKVVRQPDLERAPFFQKMFELLAEGVGYIEVVNRLNALGFKTQIYNRWDRSDKEHPKLIGKTGGNPLTVKQLQRYIQQTEYAGVNYEKWTKHQPVRTKLFDGIVPIDIFNKANRGKIYIKENSDLTVEVLHDYSPWGKIKRMRDNPLYPWKCILCPFCGSEMLASASLGKSGARFGAYHCGGAKNGKRAHRFYRVPKNEFEKSISSYLDSLKFEQGFLTGLELHLIDEYHMREKEVLVESSAISRTVSDLKTELVKKLEAFSFAETPIVRKMLEEQMKNLDEQISVAEGERTQIELTERSIRAFRKYAEEIMEHPGEILTNASDLYTRRSLMSLFFDTVPTYEEILNGTPKLTALFKLSERYKVNKSQLVTLRGIEPRLTA